MPFVGYVRTHACLSELCFFTFSGSRPPALCPLCRSSSTPCSWQPCGEAVGVGWALSVPESWNFAHISTGELFLLQRPHLHPPYRSLLLSPKHYLFLFCLPVPVLLSAHSMVLESLPAWVGSVSAMLFRRIHVLFLKI